MEARIPPSPDQESVWDYPRPPRVEACHSFLQILISGTVLAETRASFRVLETSHPPVYYFPPDSVRLDLLTATPDRSFCEWKGEATYYSLELSDRSVPNIAWSYRSPTSGFSAIARHLAFYPSKTDGCFVDGERVESQVGDFYGGWITKKIAGPFKGGPGTRGW